MNPRFIVRQLALLIGVFALIQIALGGWAHAAVLSGAADERPARWAFLVCGGLLLAVALPVLRLARGHDDQLTRRAALCLLTASWLLAPLLASAPFRVWAASGGPPDHPFHQWINCLFEATSGLTTTGSSVLPDVESLPRTILFWRSLLCWLGGLGVVVLFVTILPTVRAGSRALSNFESSGVRRGDVLPRIRSAAAALLAIYVGLTAANIAALAACGIGWFDAVCQALSTVATGGFSTRTASIAGFESVAVTWVTIGFMILSAINFGLYRLLSVGQWRQVIRDPELRVFLVVVVLGSALVALFIGGFPISSTSGAALESTAAVAATHGAFTATSISTGTGFGTVDYNAWPFAAKAVLLTLMFVGGCAGSTTGGIKVVRLWIVIRLIARQVERTFRPELVRPVLVGRRALEARDEQEAVHFVLAALAVIALGGVLLMLADESRGMDVATAFSASLTCFATTGPGLGGVGASNNFEWLSATSKSILCAVMLLGRLEIFVLLAVFQPRFWRA